MKKTMLVSGLVLFSTLLGAVSANAQEDKVANSKGTIEFTTDTGENSVIDPEDPETEVVPEEPEEGEFPGDPEDGGVTGQKGPLSIDFVSPFKFGAQNIKTTDAVYYAKPQNVTIDKVTKKVPNYLQVTDKRGTTAGWELSVKQLDQFQTDDKKSELTGSVLKLEQIGVNSIMGEKYAPVLAGNSFELSTEEKAESLLIEQTEGKGMGKWAVYFGKNKEKTPAPEDAIFGKKELDGTKGVSLSVPASAVKLKDVKYKTNLVWTLRDTVSKEEVKPEPGK